MVSTKSSNATPGSAFERLLLLFCRAFSKTAKVELRMGGANSTGGGSFGNVPFVNTSRLPFAVLILSLTAFILVLVLTAPQLPERVASHFGAAGIPDGWMLRTAYLWTMAAIGGGVSVLLPGVFYCLRFLPVSGLNLPNRDYWLSPERRGETYRVFFAAGLWLAALQVLLMLGLHLLVVEANASQPPRMSDAIWLWGGCFLLATGVLVYLLVRRFSRAV